MPKLPEAGVRFVAPGASQFLSAVGAANKAVSGFCGSSGQASKCVTALGQIAIGALRRVGELAVNGFLAAGRSALRFAENVLQAALKGSELERATQSLYAGLVQVTRVSLAPLTNQLAELVRKAGPQLLGVAQAALTHLGGLGSRALVWGQNLVTQFAQGMYNGLVSVVQALTALGNLITSWLIPGSPPRLLPDIDRWGTGAMNAYLSGFARADFTVFREIAGTVESYLRSLSTGKDTGLIPNILGAREAVAAAIAQVRQTGQVTQDMLNGVFEALGPASDAMKDYVAATLRMTLADEKVAEAQANLNRLTQEYDALLEPVNDQLASITEEQTQLAEDQRKSLLALVLQDPNASASAKRQAQLEIERIDAERARRALLAEKQDAIDAAEEQLSAAEAEQAAAQAALDIAEAKVQIEIETNNLLKEQVGLLDSLVEKVNAVAAAIRAGGAGGGIAAMLPSLDLVDRIREKLEFLRSKLAELRTAWENAWAAFKERMQPVTDFINNEVVPLLKGLLAILIGIALNGVAQLKRWWTEELLPDLEKGKAWMEEHFFPVLREFWDWLRVKLVQAVVIFGFIVNFLLIPALLGVYDILTTLVLPALGDLWIWVTTKLIPGLIQFHTTMMVWFMVALITVRDYLVDKVIPAIQDFKAEVDKQIALIKVTFDDKMAGVLTAISGPLDALGRLLQAAKDLWTWVQNNVIKFRIEIPEIVLPGSPTPFEIGLRGIADALREVNSVALAPRVSPVASPQQLALMGGGVSDHSSRNFYYQPSYTSPARAPQVEPAVAQALWGSLLA